jgi:hypothetical protein
MYSEEEEEGPGMPSNDRSSLPSVPLRFSTLIAVAIAPSRRRVICFVPKGSGGPNGLIKVKEGTILSYSPRDISG